MDTNDRAELWQIGRCRECGEPIYATATEAQGMTLPVSGRAHPWCESRHGTKQSAPTRWP